MNPSASLNSTTSVSIQLPDLCTNTLSAWYQSYSHPIIKKIMKYRLMTFEMLTVIISHLLPRILAKMEYGAEGQCSSINS